MASDEKKLNIRKYQVFISSTFKDLEKHRQEAIRGIVNAGHLPIALENYGLQSKDKETVIRQAIRSSHFYVLILGHRYGSRPKEGEKILPSYVEMELDWAEEAELEIVVFVLDEGEAQKQRNRLKRPKDREEIENEEAYGEFRKRLAGLHDYFYKPFFEAKDIYTELYAYFSREHNVPGYIPEPKDKPVSDYLQIYVRNEIVRSIVERLGKFGKVEGRLAVATERKKAMAEAFNQIHGEDIPERFAKLFIESGSTILYIAKQLAHRLPTRATVGNHRPSPAVLTNNALAYVYLWMCENVMCAPKPEGPPDDKYGGMYGSLTHRERMPDYNMPPLDVYDGEALEMIEDMSRDIFGDPEENTKTLILGAASGLQLTDQIQAIDWTTKESVYGNEELMSDICKCRGFHVGSYRNMLFKRCLYLAKAPTIVFIHDDKVDSEIEVGKCHFIFDKKVTWDSFVQEHPLSLWIACTNRSVKELLDKCRSNLIEGGWVFSKYGSASKYPIVIGHNEQFRSACSQVRVNPYSMETIA